LDCFEPHNLKRDATFADARADLVIEPGALAANGAAQRELIRLSGDVMTAGKPQNDRSRSAF
jgi:hypothetical protein